MYQPWPPQLLGGTAACLLLTFYPPVLVPFAEEWRRSGQPLDPCTRLIPRWHTAVTGTAEDIERLRRAAAAAHSRVRGPMPADADVARFGATYTASGDTMTTMYVIVLYLMLAAQEFLGHRLADDTQRDLYCELAASTAGYAFGVGDQVPATISGLRQAWQAIIDGQLQITSLGRQAREAMLARPIGGIPGRELAACAALLLPRTVAGWLGPLPGSRGPAEVSGTLTAARAAAGHRRGRLVRPSVYR
jgi:uncharacterized protein (DUF2236 family)